MTLKIRPVLDHILVEDVVVKNVSKGGIILGDAERESKAVPYGKVVAFGPLCFVGIEGCDPSEYLPHDPRSKMTPYQLAGIDVGDVVSFKRYEGEKLLLKEAAGFRTIAASSVIAVLEGEFEVTKTDF